MSIKILLADDSITIQKVIGIIFGGEEYSLTVVDNGKAAVEKAIEIIPDILLIDALMPGISGYEVCEQIRENPKLAAKPILLLTGSFEPFDETKAKNCGADDFIAKPFESQQIISKVAELYELGASRAFEEVQKETEQPETTPPPLPEEIKPVEVVAPPAQPQDIWGAFTPAEPPAEAFASFDGTLSDQTGIQTEENESSLWLPVEEKTSAFEEPVAIDTTHEQAMETTYFTQHVFGEVTLGEPAAVPEEPFETVIAPVTAPIVETKAAEPVAAAPMALSEEQLRAAIAGVSKDVIERIVWEVVPDLAEALIKEAIRKIKEGQ